MNTVSLLIYAGFAIVAIVGTPWLFIVAVLAVTQPELKTFALFREAWARLWRAIDKFASAVFLLLVLLSLWFTLILIAHKQGWITNHWIN